MTTNQTIDGVPRELLLDIEYWLKHMEAEKGVEGRCMALKELRALLDKTDAGISASTPQGEPVAHCLLRRNGSGEWVNDARSWADGAPGREIVAECEKHPELYRVRLAYAEQPAPVAVVLPERKPSYDQLKHPAYQHGWNACLDEVTRLNE